MRETVADYSVHGSFGPWVRAGGSDLARLYAERLWNNDGLVELARCTHPALRKFVVDDDGMQIGALLTLEAIASAEAVMLGYPALAAAARSIATPQIRRQATLGGNLFQSPRCPYFHDRDARCLRRGSKSGCALLIGGPDTPPMFNDSPCLAPHPSTLAVALVAHHAIACTQMGKTEPLDVMLERTPGSFPIPGKFAPGLLLAVTLPPPCAGEHAGYVRATRRSSADWPAVEAVARLVLRGRTVVDAVVVLGAVAELPWRCRTVEASLVGRRVTTLMLSRAARAVSDEIRQEARCRPQVRVIRSILCEAFERALEGPAIWPPCRPPAASSSSLPTHAASRT